MPAFLTKSAAARTLDQLLDARETQRVRASLMKTWGASLHALTLSAPQPGYALRERSGVPSAELAGRFANLSLRLAQSEAARDCLRVSGQRHERTDREGMWEIDLVAGELTDPTSRFWWSQQFRHLLGYDTVEEFPDVFESWSKSVHPDDKLVTLAAYAAHLEDRSGKTAFDACYRLKCKDGEYRWFRARGQTRRSADGTPVSTLGVLLELPAAQ
jgi:PAS domain-containing protein